MADKIAALADRIEMDIESDSEKTKVKKKENSVEDEILEYAIQYTQDGFCIPMYRYRQKCTMAMS